MHACLLHWRAGVVVGGSWVGEEFYDWLALSPVLMGCFLELGECHSLMSWEQVSWAGSEGSFSASNAAFGLRGLCCWASAMAVSWTERSIVFDLVFSTLCWINNGEDRLALDIPIHESTWMLIAEKKHLFVNWKLVSKRFFGNWMLLASWNLMLVPLMLDMSPVFIYSVCVMRFPWFAWLFLFLFL